MTNSPEDVIGVVCRVFGVSPDRVRSRVAGSQLVNARCAAYVLCRSFTVWNRRSVAQVLHMSLARANSLELEFVSRMETNQELHDAVQLCAMELER